MLVNVVIVFINIHHVPFNKTLIITIKAGIRLYNVIYNLNLACDNFNTMLNLYKPEIDRFIVSSFFLLLFGTRPR